MSAQNLVSAYRFIYANTMSSAGLDSILPQLFCISHYFWTREAINLESGTKVFKDLCVCVCVCVYGPVCDCHAVVMVVYVWVGVGVVIEFPS